ncbi:nuclear transport factor 2 family protein [Ferribacterium limneticum]|uniref:nuclear transport factor 2 family protein n=1 Tax=Ferribacterium limneticum TaxID=76259 RepID=UPI001CF890E7|nr:nuclear transport factor 2 family protein [Ferribacterium limneticum]UCV23608.1 nuclear transport factor 2 family protein [Ferribacterium limneticum]
MNQANKDTAKKFLDALGASEIETVKGLIADDIVAVCTGTSLLSGTRGHAEIVGAGDIFKKITKSGLRFEILSMTAEDDRVSVEAQGHAELVSGARYDNQYHFLFFIRDGRVFKMKEYIDTKLADAVLAPLFASAAA